MGDKNRERRENGRIRKGEKRKQKYRGKEKEKKMGDKDMERREDGGIRKGEKRKCECREGTRRENR